MKPDRKFCANDVFIRNERASHMKCGKIRRWLSAELDGELPPARRARLAEHIETCSACAQYRDALAGRERQIKALAFPAVSTSFYGQVRMKLAREAGGSRREAPRRFEWAWRWAPQAATLLIALFLGIIAGSGTASRLRAGPSAAASSHEEPVDEFLYFAAIPAATDQTDLFREIVYGEEVEAP
jgi:anti-sigma factor RsiW